jgi:hypothetical protein
MWLRTTLAGVSLLLIASGAGWAAGKNRSSASSGGSTAEASKDKEPASFNKTFQWEEKVVGPKDKRIDHDKIAAMQEQGRREDAAKRREGPKKEKRPAGVNGPAASVIPTQDIEKPLPASSVRSAPVRKASYSPPKQPDAIDDVLAENGVGSGDAGNGGLGSIIGPAKHKPAGKHAGKHARHRR